MISLMKDSAIQLTYIESKYVPATAECLVTPVSLYFVSREDDQAGFDRFFHRVYFVRHPVSGFGIGIYTPKSPCVGKTIRLGM